MAPRGEIRRHVKRRQRALGLFFFCFFSPPAAAVAPFIHDDLQSGEALLGQRWLRCRL